VGAGHGCKTQSVKHGGELSLSVALRQNLN